MLGKIASFEFRFQLFSPASVAIFAIFFLLTFGGVTIDQITVGGGGAVNINSPNALALNIVVFSLFGAIIPTVFLSSGVLRDFGFKTAELFYSRPIKETDFVLGRFIGGFLITALVFASVPIAFLLGSFMPWLDQELIGPTNLGHYLYYYTVLGLVNMWVIGTILFTVSNFTRSTVMTYTAFVALLVLYFVGLGLAQSQPDFRDTLALIDPFGVNTVGEMTRYWTINDQNTRVVPFEGVFLANRLGWLGVGLALLVLNVATFRFRQGGRSGGKKPAAAPQADAIRDIELPKATPRMGGGVSRTQFLARVNFEFKGVVLNVAFWILLVLGLLNTVPNFFFGNEFYGTPNYPVTRVMIDTINGAFTFLPFVVLIYYASEVMWRERRVGFSYIVDATPTPSWVFITTKFLALCLVAAAMFVTVIVASILSQLAMGYTQIELDQYLIRGLIDMAIPAFLFATLAIFAQVLMNNRWLGIAFMIVFLISTLVLNQIGLDHWLYQYGTPPPAPYTDMNGYGHFIGISLWFALFWAFVGLLLMVLSYRLWSRGVLSPIWARLRSLLSMPRATAATAGVALIGAVLTGGWILYNTNILNECISGPDQRRMAAEYERKWFHLVDTPQPEITAVDVEVDLYPYERRYEARGHYLLENKTDAPIETLWLTYGPLATLHVHDVEGASLGEVDEEFRTYGFDFDEPLAPGASVRLDFDVSQENPGFRNSGNNTSIRDNGSFINNTEIMPIIGFNSGARLTDRQQRRRQGLDPIERAYPLEDESRWDENYLGAQADYADFRAIVSTAPDQIAIAPGYLEREWTEKGRRYFEYVMDEPILNFYSFISGRFAVAERETDGILYQVFYHPEHDWNVERLLESGEDSIAYFSEIFSPYQFTQYRVQEFPAYATFAQSFPNTVAYSEGIGFTADLTNPQDIDYVYYINAHEAAHQWWAHQVMAANVQGGTMLVETFAQYSALMLMEREYGPDNMRRFLKFELDSYLSSRGSEAIEELPLYRVENQAYIHYRKGAVIMYALQDYLGEDTVNRSLARLVEERGFQTDPYATTLDYLRILKEEAGEEWHGLIEDFFERIVLFDLTVEDAITRQLEDGRWETTLSVSARKLEADGEGEETEIPLDLPIDIGLFTEDLNQAFENNDHVLMLEKRPVTDGEMEFVLVTDTQPTHAGIDPYNKLIDRNSDDNLTSVSVAD